MSFVFRGSKVILGHAWRTDRHGGVGGDKGISLTLGISWRCSPGVMIASQPWAETNVSEVWRSSPYSPTFSYPFVLFLSSTARAVVFSRLGVVCLTKPHGTHYLNLAENTCFQVLGLKILFHFFGFENRWHPGLASGELNRESLFRIDLGTFWYCHYIYIYIL
jgi:hypothetical protein